MALLSAPGLAGRNADPCSWVDDDDDEHSSHAGSLASDACISAGDILAGLRVAVTAACDGRVDARIRSRTGLRLRKFLADLRSLEAMGVLSGMEPHRTRFLAEEPVHRVKRRDIVLGDKDEHGKGKAGDTSGEKAQAGQQADASKYVVANTQPFLPSDLPRNPVVGGPGPALVVAATAVTHRNAADRDLARRRRVTIRMLRTVREQQRVAAAATQEKAKWQSKKSQDVSADEAQAAVVGQDTTTERHQSKRRKVESRVRSGRRWGERCESGCGD